MTRVTRPDLDPGEYCRNCGATMPEAVCLHAPRAGHGALCEDCATECGCACCDLRPASEKTEADDQRALHREGLLPDWSWFRRGPETTTPQHAQEEE